MTEWSHAGALRSGVRAGTGSGAGMGSGASSNTLLERQRHCHCRFVRRGPSVPSDVDIRVGVQVGECVRMQGWDQAVVRQLTHDVDGDVIAVVVSHGTGCPCLCVHRLMCVSGQQLREWVGKAGPWDGTLSRFRVDRRGSVFELANGQRIYRISATVLELKIIR